MFLFKAKKVLCVRWGKTKFSHQKSWENSRTFRYGLPEILSNKAKKPQGVQCSLYFQGGGCIETGSDAGRSAVILQPLSALFQAGLIILDILSAKNEKRSKFVICRSLLM